MSYLFRGRGSENVLNTPLPRLSLDLPLPISSPLKRRVVKHEDPVVACCVDIYLPPDRRKGEGLSSCPKAFHSRRTEGEEGGGGRDGPLSIPSDPSAIAALKEAREFSGYSNEAWLTKH